MKKLLALFILAALLLPLAACGGGSDTPAQTGAATGAETTATAETDDPNDRTKVKDGVPDLDFKGTTLNVYYRGSDAGNGSIDLYDVLGSDNVGENVTDAVWERNRRTEDRLNIAFNFIPANASSLGDMQTKVQNTVMAGSDEYDYINSTGNTNITRGLNIYMRDLANLPYVDYNAAWWWKDVINDISIDGKTYSYIFGDMCVYNYIQTGCFYYNKVLYENLFGKQDEMYEIVLSGDWTLDLLMEKTAAAYKDANGNGTPDKGDVFGYMKTQNQGEETPHLLEGCALDLYHRDADGNLIIEFDQDRCAIAVEKLGKLMMETTGVFHSDLTIDTSDQYFIEGNILFFPARFARAVLGNLRNMEDPYGILPYPKLDKDQANYYSLIHNSSTNICVPKTVGSDKLEVLGATFEVQCAESWRSVMPLFLESALKLKYSQDVQSGQVIDIVVGNLHKNTLEEYQSYTSSLFQNALTNPARNNTNNFASAYASNVQVAQNTWNASVAKLKES